MFGGELTINDKRNDYNQRNIFNKDITWFCENFIMVLFITHWTYDSNENNIIITNSYIQIYNEKA